jgi:hypothetical protein
MSDQTKEPNDEAPDSGPDKSDAPAVVYWRWEEQDRVLFGEVREMSHLKSTAEVLRFALGAARRELTRAGGTP